MTKKLKFKTIFLLIIFFSFFGVVKNSEAAPAISSVSGTISTGESVTISGLGFGSGDTTILSYDDFEDGIDGNNLSSSPKVGSWQVNSNPTPKYSTTYAHSGSQSSYANRDGETNMYSQFAVPGSAEQPMTDTYYYISWWGRYYNPCSTTGQVKMVQLWGTYQQGDYNPGIMYGVGSSTYIALENSGMTELTWPSYPSQSTWHFFELILKQSTADTANGDVTIRVDGINSYQRNNVKTRERVGESWLKNWTFEGMSNQSGCGGESKYLAIDDIYCNNSWARVMLGDSAIYENCTQLDVQPVDWLDPQWTTSSIKVKINTGNRSANEIAYLFVIDENGEASDGYPVTLGAEPDTTPPSAPSGLGVE